MDERAFHPLDYLSVLRRRKWWLIAPVALGIVVGALLAAFWPQAVPLRGPDRDRRAEADAGAAPQRQLARPRRAAARDLAAAPEPAGPRARRPRGEAESEQAGRGRGRLAQDAESSSPSTSRSAAAATIGTGSTASSSATSMPSPDRAQSITNRLAYVFVEENSKTQTERAENTSEVLGQQLQASQERLAALEAQLRAKKEANMGRLPDQVGANLAMANGLRQSFDSYSMQLRSEQDRLSQLDSQIDDMRRGAITAPIPSSVGPGHPGGTQARIAQLQQQLTQEKALGKTDKHPDIISLQGEMTNARAELAAIKQPADANREELLQGDPIYRQRVQERDAARLRVNTLRAQSAQASAQIGAYQSRVEAAPMVEQDLASVTRDVELEKARYTDLKTKYENARLAEDLARQQGGERFSVLYPAYPGRPANPGQSAKLLLMAIAAGFVLGAAMVVGREFLDRSVHDARALQSEFEIPVLGEIPRIHGAA